MKPFKYAFESIAYNEFEGKDYGLFDPIKLLNLNLDLWSSFFILLGLTVITMIGALGILKHKSLQRLQ